MPKIFLKIYSQKYIHVVFRIKISHTPLQILVRDGARHNKHGDIQKFECRDCKRYFTINIGFEKMKHNPQDVTTDIQLYFSREKLRNVARSLALIGVEVSHQTIYNWTDKYCMDEQTP